MAHFLAPLLVGGTPSVAAAACAEVDLRRLTHPSCDNNCDAWPGGFYVQIDVPIWRARTAITIDFHLTMLQPLNCDQNVKPIDHPPSGTTPRGATTVSALQS